MEDMTKTISQTSSSEEMVVEPEVVDEETVVDGEGINSGMLGMMAGMMSGMMPQAQQEQPQPEVIPESACVPAIIYIPPNTAMLNITAVMMRDDGSLYEATNHMNITAVIDARIDGEEYESNHEGWNVTENNKSNKKE